MSFEPFAKKLEKHFDTLAKQQLYVVDVSIDSLWDTYQDSFPEGENEIYKERKVLLEDYQSGYITRAELKEGLLVLKENNNNVKN